MDNIRENLTRILTDDPDLLKNLNTSVINLIRLVGKMIDNGVTVQEWISVDDRLPNHGDIVLCNTRYHYEVLQWDGRANRWVNNFMNPKKEYVTHWMHLPQPPKEG